MRQRRLAHFVLSQTSVFLRTTLLAIVFTGFGCVAENVPPPDGGVDVQQSDVPFDSTPDDTSADGSVDMSVASDASEDAEEPDASTPRCGCFLGEGSYCGARASRLARDEGCSLPIATNNPDELLSCSEDGWSVLEDCPGSCDFNPMGHPRDDSCELPVCDCFVREAWCGSGAQEVADERHCRIPLLPRHNGDILHCPGGEWAVRTSCEHGCVSAPVGTPDSCRGDSDYRLPFNCGASFRCSSGNNTSNHNGKDHYAYDFAMPRGTQVRAMRGGRVIGVRQVSNPGSACYDGGGSACANLANTVEVRHSDGSVALYMHLNRSAVSEGDRVDQGDVIGRSGNSGWSTGPHLHVQVQRNCGIWWCQSVPFTFREGRVRTGGTYSSENCR